MPKKDESQVPVPTPEQAQAMLALQHRVQSGIAFLMGQAELKRARFQQCEPKFLRVGVNSALVETSALARLLFRKGLITADEYYNSLIEAWEEEVDSYRRLVKEIDGRLEI